MEIPVGTKGYAEEIVSDSRTAASMQSGELPVYATPAMTALMEKAAYTSIAPFLDDGKTSVGTMLNIKHSASTPAGGSIRAEAEVTEADGRRILFSVKAFDSIGLIGEGTHERFIVTAESFLEKSKKRAKGA